MESVFSISFLQDAPPCLEKHIMYATSNTFAASSQLKVTVLLWLLISATRPSSFRSLHRSQLTFKTTGKMKKQQDVLGAALPCPSAAVESIKMAITLQGFREIHHFSQFCSMRALVWQGPSQPDSRGLNNPGEAWGWDGGGTDQNCLNQAQRTDPFWPVLEQGFHSSPYSSASSWQHPINF